MKLKSKHYEWNAIHLLQDDLVEYNKYINNPLTKKELDEIYHQQLIAYFKKYPNEITEYFTNLLKI